MLAGRAEVRTADAPGPPRPAFADRPRRRAAFGALAWWELVRLARRGQAARARVLVLYALLLAAVGFAVVWSYLTLRSPTRLLRLSPQPIPAAAAAEFSRSLAIVLLEAQLLLVAVVTPAYAAAALSEEKDRHTLPLLLATDLTDGEIVWGKVLGRVLLVLLAVLAGVPVMAVTLFLGGVDLGLLASGYALTAGTTVLCAAIGASAASHAPDSRGALVRAYGQTAAIVFGLLLPPFVLLTPFAMLLAARLDAGENTASLRFACGFAYPLAQVLLAAAIVNGASRNLRRAGATAGPPERTAYPEPPRGRPVPIVFAPHEPEPAALPPVGENDPVLWKERHVGRARPLPVLDAPARWLGALVAVAAVTTFVTGGWGLVARAIRAIDPAEATRLSRHGPEPPDPAGGLMVAAGVLAAGLYLLPLAAGVAGCVAGERHRGTLDPLLATPLGRRGVLFSKVRAHVERGLVFAVGAATAVGCGFGADGGLKLGAAAIAALLSGFAFTAALAAWLSVRCETPVRAFRLALPAVVLVIGLPALVRNWVAWESVGDAVAVLGWAAGLFAAAAGVLWWRAGTELSRGTVG